MAYRLQTTRRISAGFELFVSTSGRRETSSYGEMILSARYRDRHAAPAAKTCSRGDAEKGKIETISDPASRRLCARYISLDCTDLRCLRSEIAARRGHSEKSAGRDNTQFHAGDGWSLTPCPHQPIVQNEPNLPGRPGPRTAKCAKRTQFPPARGGTRPERRGVREQSCRTNPICHPPRWDQRDRLRRTKPIAPWKVSGEDAQPTKSGGPFVQNEPNCQRDEGSGVSDLTPNPDP